ncbi:MAG TPA: endonuclease domain-containing protein, partial [Micropepsaceae bacterium]|nr:endonuclease domain-containing protein [Micropepsaceae bacterium]
SLASSPRGERKNVSCGKANEFALQQQSLQMKVPNTPQARRLRSAMTDAERKLWFALRNRQLAGLKFRRQKPVGQFIADFACAEASLIVEVDGGQHYQDVAADRQRTAIIETLGWRVLRFSNLEVLDNLPGVLDAIGRAARNTA